MFSRCLRSRKGLSNVTEYVILVAVVAGAAIAMQQYVKTRLQGATKSGSDEYETQMGYAFTAYTVTFEPARTTISNATTGLNMTSATVGSVAVDSLSNIDQTK